MTTSEMRDQSTPHPHGAGSRGLSRRELLIGAAAATATFGAGRARAQAAPAMVLANGRFWTNDPSRPSASAIGVQDGLIVAVGDVREVRGALPGAEVIDLQGMTVIPGLTDSHTHVIRGGRFYAAELRWDGVTSLERGLAMIAEQARRTPPGQWVRVVGGWSPHQFAERRLPTPEELTRAAPDTPVFVAYLYSRGFLNRAGVQALGLTPETIVEKTQPGTRYELGASGAVLHAEPNPGLIYGTIGALPPLTAEDQIASSRSFYRELTRFGLTGVVDAGGGGHAFPEDYGSSDHLARAGELPLRVSYDLFPQKPGRELDDFRAWTRDYALNQNLAEELEHGFELDGAGEFLTWTAGDFENFLAPRPDLDERPGWREELTAVTRTLLRARWPLRMHATYDESITKIMEVFEAAHAAEQAEGRPGFAGVRWAIDHAETVSPANIARIGRLGGGVAIQNRMAFAGEFFAERYGREAAASAPPLRDLIESGVPLGAGTDGTRVSSYNPWLAVQWMITGATVGGERLMGERHRLSREEALRLWTSGSAWFAGEEALRGRLAPGLYADLAVLSDDVFAVDERRIGGIESVLTMTGGAVVHGAGPFAGLAPEMPTVSPSWSPVARFGGFEAG